MDKKFLLGLVVVVAIAALMIISCKPVQEEEKEQEGVLVSVSPASGEVDVGSTIVLSVNVANINDLFGFQFNLGYNSELLEFSGLEQGTFLGSSDQNDVFCVDYVSSPGVLKNIACTRIGGAGVSGSGLLEKVSFKALAPGTSDMVLSNVKLVDSKANSISLSVADSKVNIK